MKPYWIPTASDIDFFLVPYGLKDEDKVERIEIRNPEDSTFQFTMLAIWRKEQDEISLIAMWPDDSKDYPTSDMT